VLVGRQQETPRYRFRSDRLFHSNGAWYFATREAIAVGPYMSRGDAELAARELVEQLSTIHADAARGAVIDAQTAALLSADTPRTSPGTEDPQIAHTG
jgi:hypothetical protein